MFISQIKNENSQVHELDMIKKIKQDRIYLVSFAQVIHFSHTKSCLTFEIIRKI